MFFKIGENAYKNADDKNCGLFEYNKMKENCKAEDKLFIVNGSFSNKDEEEKLIDLIKDFEKKDIVFILTDLSLLGRNYDILKKCGTVLHSSKDESFLKDECEKSMYSFIPDMYYENDRIKNELKSDVIMFGGSFGNTILEDETVRRYVISSGKVNEKIIFMYKKDNVDFRINYENYKKILDTCKYNLCVKRKEFIKYKWVTPRLLDSISSYCFPIVDIDYDCEYNYPDELKVRNYGDARRMILSLKEDDKDQIIKMLREEAESKVTMFRNLVNNL